MSKKFNQSDIEKNLIINGLNIMPGGFLIYRGDDKNDEILYVNSALLEIFECKNEQEFMELTGGTFTGMVFKEDVRLVINSINVQIKSNLDRFDQVNYRIKTKNGHVKYVEDFGRLYEDPEEGPLFYVFISDMQSMQDPLTGLPSRWGFFNKAEIFEKEALSKDQTPVMVAFDLSGMKGFNARFGVNEGDRLLCIFADILRKNFGNSNCSRFGEDHFFAFTLQDGIEDKIKTLIQDLLEANRGMTLPVKIGTCSYQQGMSVHLACDYARMACDAQKVQYGSSYGNFDEKMAQRYVKAEYILSHLDQAINEGWIHVFLQPVIRTLSGRVCGCEALARWIDPVYGFISPGDFIPLLEENGLSYKLDTFMVKRVAEMQARNIKAGNPVVPVSVNISRSDFDYCDPVDVIVNAMDERNVRRDLICVEITETALMNDSGLIKQDVQRFHDAGIQIWMDDFGSGYSSLNILKDFDFDEIKIDMLFLKDFSDKSKTIITMAVKMAKELGIHTLAEGVETKEQLEFLKSIGCEKIQGYYYSKPMAVSDIRRHLSDNGLIFETREVKSVFEKTGLIDVATDQAIALFFYDGSKFNLIYCNANYQDVVGVGEDYTYYDIESYMNKDDSMSSNKFRQLAEKTIESHQEERMTYIYNGRYYRISFRDIADSRQGCMIYAFIDCKEYEDQQQMQMYDHIMRNVISAFDCIYLIDFKADKRTVIYSNLVQEKVGDEITGLHDFYRNYTPRLIYPDDLPRWFRFIDPDLYKRPVTNRFERSFSDVFRVKDSQGNYVWTEFMIVLIADGEDRRALVCVKPSDIERQANVYKAAFPMQQHGDNDYNINDDLMDAIKQNSGVRFFWKDTNRRFVGVTQAFLDYYGFESQDAVIGKTDEEVGWHIDDSPFMSDEERVLQKGEVIHDAIGQNIVDGVTRYIAATKFPIYNKGKIIGLMGYMIDVERDIQSENKLKKGSLIDPITGCMNATGQMITLTQLDDNLRTSGEDYIYFILDVPDFEDIRVDYGRSVAEDYIKTVFNIIVDTFGHVASIFRIYGCRFGVTRRNISVETALKLATKWKEKVDRLREIDGRQIILTSEFAFATGTEKETIEEIVALAGNRFNQKLNGTMIKDVHGASLIKEYYDNMPLPYVVARPILDSDGKTPIDIEYIYVNYKYCEVCGKNAQELIGNRYRKVFPRVRTTKWVEIANRASSGEYIYERTFSYAVRHWVNFIAAPGSHAGTFSTVFINMDEDIRHSDAVISDHATDAANISIARILDGDLDYEVSINKALKEIAGVIKADRVFVFRNELNDGFNDSSIIHRGFEWCEYGIDENIESQTTELNHLTVQWKQSFESKRSLLLDDIYTIKESHPDIYNYLKGRNVNSLIIVPMYGGDRIIGFMGAYNYVNDVSVDVLRFLENSAYFIASKIMLNVLKQKEHKINIEKDRVSRRLETENTAIRIARVMSGTESYDTAMNKMLNILKESITCERIFIMEVGNGTISNTFEWCDEKVNSVIDKWQNISIDNYSMQFKEFKPGTSLVINDVEKYKFINPLRANYLIDQSIRNVIEAPFYNDGVLLGFIGVDNYDPEDEENIKHILENLALFMGFSVHNNVLQRINNAMHVVKNLTSNKNKTDISTDTPQIQEDISNTPDMYNNIPMAYIVGKIEIDINSLQAVDFEFVFVNKVFCQQVGKSKREIEGKHYKELFFDIDPIWITEGYQAAVEGRKISGRKFSVVGGIWVDYHMMPGPDEGTFVLTMSDVTIEYRKQIALQKDSERDKVLLDIAGILSSEASYQDVMDDTLSSMLKYFYASRVYIVTILDGVVNTAFQHCAMGISPNTNRFDDIDRYFVENAKKNLLYNGNIIKVNIKSVKENNKIIYDKLCAINVRNMAGAPLMSDKEIIGYVCVENYEVGKIDELEHFLTTVATFISHRLLQEIKQ